MRCPRGYKKPIRLTDKSRKKANMDDDAGENFGNQVATYTQKKN